MKFEEKLYKKSVEIAEKAYSGIFRNDGTTPYMKHPEMVADMFDNYLDKSIAILHDAIEDGKKNGVDFSYIEKELYAIDKSKKHEKEI